ncbi:hypothetical protein BDZ91DRAFT_800785 [Kalaharituber pfeilii]|nr:hypothetical protein BDZ91DRAFT_800785 [Kalaharituber pfeilii]
MIPQLTFLPDSEYLRGSLTHREPLALHTFPFHPSDLTKEEWEGIIAKEEDEGWESIYTDGSRMDETTGAGIYYCQGDTSIYLVNRSTVNDGELLAISHALKKDRELMIVTDSRTAIARLQRIARGDPTPDGASQAVRERWEARAAKGEMDLSVLWGNTKADKAAKVGTALQYQDERVTEAGICQNARALRAEERNRLNMTYRPLKKLGSRKLTATLAGILGNKGLREWRHRIGKADSSECRWCGRATCTPKSKPLLQHKPEPQPATPAIVVHGITVTKRLGNVRKWLEVDDELGVKIAGARWLLKQERREGKTTSSVVIYLEGAGWTSQRPETLRIGGKKYRWDTYEWDRGRRDKGKGLVKAGQVDMHDSKNTSHMVAFVQHDRKNTSHMVAFTQHGSIHTAWQHLLRIATVTVLPVVLLRLQPVTAFMQHGGKANLLFLAAYIPYGSIHTAGQQEYIPHGSIRTALQHSCSTAAFTQHGSKHTSRMAAFT